MKYSLAIPVQRLFGTALIIKIGTATAGWYFRSPWIFGFTLPLLVMSGYILLGRRRKSDDVSDEKFADSCYYLGFIFTITSIIFCLIDLPNIGTRIQDISVRFGAAMVSTVLGLAVRVYMVSFRRDMTDAVRATEQGIFQATERLQSQLLDALRVLKKFEAQVDAATSMTIQRVSDLAEKSTQDHATRLAEFFATLAQENRDTVKASMGQIARGSERLNVLFDQYANSLGAGVMKVENKLDAFSEAMTQRLKTTTFPDDFFARHLQDPLAQLKSASESVSQEVRANAEGMRVIAKQLGKAFETMNGKAETAVEALDAVGKLGERQRAILESAHGQQASMTQLGQSLATLERILAALAGSLEANHVIGKDLLARINDVAADGHETQGMLRSSLGEVTRAISAGAATTSTALEKAAAMNSGHAHDLQRSIVLVSDLSAALKDTTTATQLVAGKLGDVAASNSHFIDRVAVNDARMGDAASLFARAAGELSGVHVQLKALLEQRIAPFSTITMKGPAPSDLHVADGQPLIPVRPASTVSGEV